MLNSLLVRRFDSLFALLTLFFMFCFAGTFAQNNSPYSRFAIGDIQPTGFAQNVAMGGTGFAGTNPFGINIQNPASYTSLMMTCFEAGVFSKGMISESGAISQKTNNTSVSYIALGFPINKWWGTSFGLLPYSKVAYRISDYDSIQNVGGVDFIYEGTGGINQVFLGNGFKPIKNLSIGFNVSYLFGTINHSQKAIFENSQFFNTRANNQTRANDIYLRFGVNYSYKINDKYRLVAGAVYSSPSSIRAFNDQLAEQFKFSTTGKEVPTDTTINTQEQKGNISLPEFYGFGVSLFTTNKWNFTGDFSFQPWKNYTAFGSNDTLANSTNIAVGAQYVPEIGSPKFFKNVQYRAGFRYSKSYLQLRETQLNDYALSLGVALPIKKERSTINISFELGQRGTTEQALIKEKYGKLTVGMTLNDKWFTRSKID